MRNYERPEHVSTCEGRTPFAQDVIAKESVEKMAATLNNVNVINDGRLPPLWHWMFFQSWPTGNSLGSDGHPARGAFLPSLPAFPRRMWAGGKVTFERTLRVGDRIERQSRILRVEQKIGASGEFVLVTVGHTISSAEGIAITEEQDLVFLSAALRKPPPPTEAPNPPDGSSTTFVCPNSVTLFRFSALTGNAHRIHYDLPYAQQLEGYPALVVHGPLQAIWLAGLVHAAPNLPPLHRFIYRSERPAFADEVIGLQMWHEAKEIRLRTLNSSGSICTRAEARFARLEDPPA